jgi:hypothetical protein
MEILERGFKVYLQIYVINQLRFCYTHRLFRQITENLALK